MASSDLHANLADAELSVAPMMAYTDRHCRYLHRLLAPKALLFTEMVSVGALLHGPRERLLAMGPASQNIALQLGGSNPTELAQAATIAADWGYAEINLNVGCPSDRVRQGAFGACLMREPNLVAQCVTAMRQASPVPVTVKCRLGVDDLNDYASLALFARTVEQAGCQRLYVHARRAILGGLSPAENRRIPPLIYGRVHALAAELAPLPVVINGGFVDVGSVLAQLPLTSGIMLGRAAYHNPALLAQLSSALELRSTEQPDASVKPSPKHSSINSTDAQSQAFARYRDYVAEQAAIGTPLTQLTKPLLGLFSGQPGARRYRRTLSDSTRLKMGDAGLLDSALQHLPQSLAA